jgi:hypothetical protein
MQNYNLKLKTKKKVLNFELWFLVFLPVRCLTASACLCRHGRQVLALPVRYTQTGQAGTQTGCYKFLV